MMCEEHVVPLLNLLVVSTAWWAPESCIGWVINEKVVRGEAVFQAVFPGLKGGLQWLKWMHESQKKAGSAVTFFPYIIKLRCLIQGSVSTCPCRSRWVADACSLSCTTHNHTQYCSLPGIFEGYTNYVPQPPPGNKSNLCDTRGKE